MPFFEYVLLALLGSTGAAVPGTPSDGGSTSTIINADSIVQPNGGVVGDYAQKKPVKERSATKSPGRNKGGRRHHRRVARNSNGAKPDSFTIKQK